MNAVTISPQELGRRIGAARRSRNLSQEDVARHLGLSRPTMVAIEKGSRSLKPQELVQLCELLQRSVHELLRNGAFATGFMPQFRLTPTTGLSNESVDSAVREFQGLCEDFLTLEQILDRPMPHFHYPEAYSIEKLNVAAAAEDIAQQERARLSLGDGPIPDLLDVLENDAGLRVFVAPLSEFAIAGMFHHSETLGACILVNARHPLTRQR
jgi:transcriptional regulator with XRE-family HTH domain